VIKCREMTDFLLDYLDGELPAEQEHAFDVHLAMCPHCQDYVRSYRAALEASRAAMSDDAPAMGEPPPEELIDAIVKASRA